MKQTLGNVISYSRLNLKNKKLRVKTNFVSSTALAKSVKFNKTIISFRACWIGDWVWSTWRHASRQLFTISYPTCSHEITA